MAIAFRSAGARLKADIGISGGSQSVALPPGHVSGDFLLLFIVTDANSVLTADPAGWTRMLHITPSGATQTPYNAPSRLMIYRRVDNGSLGSSVPLTYSTAAWPAGNPWTIAFTVAYTGVDPAAGVERFEWRTTTSTAAAQAHQPITTVGANDWILTFRASSAFAAATFTNSVGTDAERVDDTDGFNELSCVLYDSNASVAPGAQPVRTTTASRTSDYGSVLVTLALKPPAGAGSTTPLPSGAGVTATAYSPTVQAQNGPWSLCAADGLPAYRFAIDWNGDSSFTNPVDLGSTYVTDAFGRTVSGGWGTADTGQTWAVGSPASDFSVSSGAGLHTVGVVNSPRFATLASPSADVDLAVDFSTAAVASGASVYTYLMARHTDPSNFYSTRVQMSATQTVAIGLRKRVGGTETEVAFTTTSLTHTAGTVYTVRLRLAGSSLWAKVWATGTVEPGWQVSAVDTDLTAAAGVGVRSLIGAGSTNTLPLAFSFDNLRVSAPLDAEDVTDDIISDISVTYGRDQERQLNPAAVGSAAFTLRNDHRRYSPENAASPLFSDLDPARTMTGKVDFNGLSTPLFRGRVDEFNVKADYGDRAVDFTFLDGLNDLAGVKLSTAVYASQRTGDLINTVLDLAGWTGGRDIDRGATVVRYWWLEDADALSAVNDLVKSEGPPSIAYVNPAGTFVYRDRHHRIQRAASRNVRASFAAGRLGDCTATEAPAGSYDFTRPFTYSHGWRDIVNSVSFEVEERAPDGELAAVWTDESSYTLAAGQSVDLDVSASDPFMDAVTPVLGTDVLYTGGGVPNVLLSRDSGVSTRLTLRAVGGPVTVTFLQLRARPIPVRRTSKVQLTDPGSISTHGERSYPEAAPWAGTADAEAIANMILLHYAHRRPTVQLRIVSQDPAHFMQVLQRTISDRIHISNGEMGLDDDFFVERVTHSVQRIGKVGRPPVHSVVLGCEKDLVISTNPFTFDKRGAGFDAGTFDVIQADSPDAVFTFDDPVQGQFDTGIFGT